MSEKALRKIIEHIYEFPNELGADLETGSHNLNNAAWDAFHKKHRNVTKWVTKLTRLAEAADDEDANIEDDDDDYY